MIKILMSHSDSDNDTWDDESNEILLSRLNRQDPTEIIDNQSGDNSFDGDNYEDNSFDGDNYEDYEDNSFDGDNYEDNSFGGDNYDSEELNMTHREIYEDNIYTFWLLMVVYISVLTGTGTLAISFSCGEGLHNSITGECVVKIITTVMFFLQILLSFAYLIYRFVRQWTAERRIEERVAMRVIEILEEYDIDLSSLEDIEIIIDDGYI